MAQTMFGDIFSARQTGMEDLEKSAATLAALQPGRGSVYAAGMAGGMLGRGLGQAFGAQTPEEAKMSKMQEIQAQFSDLDMSQPENMRKVQSAFWQAGLYDQATKVADMIDQRVTADAAKTKAESSGSDSMKEWMFNWQTKLQNTANRAMELGVDITPAQLMRVTQQAKDEVSLHPETGDMVNTTDLLLLAIQKQNESASGQPTSSAARQPMAEVQPVASVSANVYDQVGGKENFDLLPPETQRQLMQQTQAQPPAQTPAPQAQTPTTGVEEGSAEAAREAVYPDGETGFTETPASQTIQAQKDAEKERRNEELRIKQEGLRLREQEAKRQRDLDNRHNKEYVAKEVRSLSEALSGDSMPILESSMNDLEEALREFPDSLPGVGTLDFSKLDVLTKHGDKARMLGQRIAAVQNAFLRYQSGAAVTDPEFQRFKAQFEGGFIRTEQELRDGVAGLRRGLENWKRGIFAGYGQNIKEIYWSRGGITQKGQGRSPASEIPDMNPKQQATFRWMRQQYPTSSNKQILQFMKDQGAM